MKVKEMLEKLKDMPPDADIEIAPTWTIPAQSIKNVVKMGNKTVFLNKHMGY